MRNSGIPWGIRLTLWHLVTEILTDRNFVQTTEEKIIQTLKLYSQKKGQKFIRMINK